MGSNKPTRVSKHFFKHLGVPEMRAETVDAVVGAASEKRSPEAGTKRRELPGHADEV